jgi:hypothetical protein
MAAIFFFLMAAALLYRVLWPLLSRILYALERNQLIRQHKLLGTIGLAPLFDALSNSSWAMWLKSVIAGHAS